MKGLPKHWLFGDFKKSNPKGEIKTALFRLKDRVRWSLEHIRMLNVPDYQRGTWESIIKALDEALRAYDSLVNALREESVSLREIAEEIRPSE